VFKLGWFFICVENILECRFDLSLSWNGKSVLKMSQSNGPNGTGELVKSKRQIKSEAKRSLGLIKDKLRFLQKAVGRYSDLLVATVPISALLNVGNLRCLLGDNALSDNLGTELLRTRDGYDTNA